MEQFIKIAVIGGTGKAGKYLVKKLINRGFKIKVLLRNPGKLEVTSHLVKKISALTPNPLARGLNWPTLKTGSI
jgi:uncharacterized protein YbjT (DUF2867 family)